MLNINNEKGLTLVEVLATLLISSIILTFVGNFLIQGMNSYEKTAVETVLRDEADIIMAHISRDIFTLKQSEIDDLKIGGSGNNKYAYILLTNGTKVGIEGNIIITRHTTYPVLNNSVKLLSNFSIIPSNSSVPKEGYIIEFTLQHEKKKQQRTFKNEILTVKDS